MFRKKRTYDYTSMSLEEAVAHFYKRGTPGIKSPAQSFTPELFNELLENVRSGMASDDQDTVWLAEDIRTYLMLHGHNEHDIRPTALEFNRSYQMFKRPATKRTLLWQTKLSLWWEKLTKLFRHR